MKAKNADFLNPIIAVIVSIFLSALFYAGLHFTESAERLFLLLGGDIVNGGLIQFLLYVGFLWSILEIRGRLKNIKYERRFLNMNLLVEKEQYVYYTEDVKNLKLQVIEKDQQSPSFLTSILKQASTKYVRTKNVSEVMAFLDQQTDINLQKAESGQSLIRYLVWAIPSIGFIGTIWGIAGSLGLVTAEISPEQMKLITDTLSVAFDTTLIALVLSIIVMFRFHSMQEKEEVLHTSIQEYVMENFINRLAEEN